MKLLIVRHAVAGDRERFARTGRPDALRPLTARGRRRMREAAAGLRELLPSVDLLGSSPLLRAKETADILADVYREPRRAVIPALAPGSAPEKLLTWLSRRPERTVALVGHEPHLGRWIGFLLTGRPESFLELKKGHACLLEFAGTPGAGRAKLLWSLKPSQLRRLER